MVLALRLLRLGHRTGVGQESINCHFLSCYHIVVLVGLNYFWLNWLGWSLLLFNRYMHRVALRLLN